MSSEVEGNAGKEKVYRCEREMRDIFLWGLCRTKKLVRSFCLKANRNHCTAGAHLKNPQLSSALIRLQSPISPLTNSNKGDTQDIKVNDQNLFI